MALKLARTFRGWKHHRCTGCGAVYRYRFDVAAAVVARTPERREAKLRAVLDRLVAAAVEMRPCPQCGRYQPDMIARQRRVWTGWTLFAIWFGLFWVAAIGVNGHAAIPPLTLGAMGYLAVCAGVLAWAAWHHPNADLARNLDRAAEAREAGTLRRDEPGTEEAPTPPPPAPGWRRAGAAFAVLLALAVGLPTLAEGKRRAAGWPLNPTLFPPVVGPGDQTTFYLPGLIRCVHGYWHGEAAARLTNAADLGLTHGELPATTNDFRWADDLAVNPAQPDQDMHPWVTFTLPGDATLARRTARVNLRLHTEYPRMVSDSTFVTGERDLAAEVALVLAASGAGWTYQCLWHGALVGSGALLTLAAWLSWGGSRRQGQSTQTRVTPLEER